MPLDPPDIDTGTASEWYMHFRMMAYQPAMPANFKEVMREVTTMESLQRIMTGYVATAANIAVFFSGNKAIDQRFLHILDSEFDLPPASFLHLNARTIAQLAQIDEDVFCDSLKDLGFAISDQGQVTAFAVPKPDAGKPAPRGPKSP